MSAKDRKTHAEADKLKATAKEIAAQTKRGSKGTAAKRTKGTGEKKAEWYRDTYKLTKIQSTDMVRLEAANMLMHQEMEDFRKELELMGEEPDEEQRASIDARAAELKKKYMPVPPPVQKKARGLPTDESGFTTDIAKDFMKATAGSAEKTQGLPPTKARPLPTAAKGEALTQELARQFMKAADGDRAKAEKMAKEKGYTF